MASQFRCTSKSVDLLDSVVSTEIHAVRLAQLDTHYAGNNKILRAADTTAH